jgi:hypothetical protein
MVAQRQQQQAKLEFISSNRQQQKCASASLQQRTPGWGALNSLYVCTA